MNRGEKEIKMPLEDFEEMQNQIKLMSEALKDKTFTIMQYYGYPYHIVNPTDSMRYLGEQVNNLNEDVTRLKKLLQEKETPKLIRWLYKKLYT